jgi:hypothetical protein
MDGRRDRERSVRWLVGAWTADCSRSQTRERWTQAAVAVVCLERAGAPRPPHHPRPHQRLARVRPVSMSITDTPPPSFWGRKATPLPRFLPPTYSLCCWCACVYGAWAGECVHGGQAGVCVGGGQADGCVRHAGGLRACAAASADAVCS